MQNGLKMFYWRATQDTDKIISRTLSETFVNCNWVLNQVLTGVCDYEALLRGCCCSLTFHFFLSPENHRRCETPAWAHTARGLLASSLQDVLCVRVCFTKICQCASVFNLYLYSCFLTRSAHICACLYTVCIHFH